MDETNRNSMKLDIEAVRLSETDHDQPTETYKQVSEFSSNEKSTVTNMAREKADNVEDGADEKMLDADEKQQLARRDEVKFIASDRSNGDAKIDIGNIEKSFTGMTKEELMKYANDPFWQRLRWIFFIAFWLLWAAMLAGAIWIIMKAPKCSIAEPLPWYKEGPLIEMPKNVDYTIKEDLKEKLKAIGTKGVIYNLPADKTYKLNESDVQDYIKGVLNVFKDTDSKVIFDLTPNYVDKDNRLFKEAVTNHTLRDAFVWKETEMTSNNWVSKVESNRTENSAWQKLSNGNHVLSQFGSDNFDLQMNDPFAKEMFKDVLRQLARMGVKGFRLANAKHYIINKEAPNEGISKQIGAGLKDYSFFTHTQSTNQPGLGELLYEFANVVSNETNKQGFLTVTDFIDQPDIFSRGNKFGFELPILTNLTNSLHPMNDGQVDVKKLHQKSESLNNSTIWQQWQLSKLSAQNGESGTSASNIFIYLLPGVPIGPISNLNQIHNATINEIKRLEELRKSPSYQHGTFQSYLGHNDTVIEYTRLKTGFPGFFVAYNPTNANVTVDFKAIEDLSLPEQLSKIDLASGLAKDSTETVPTNAVPLPANSAVVFRYAKTNA